ncbi:MAG TPA: tetratricopeptide repeat protein [Chthonomonadaceae bacterium]|nr:tetratricopeptide repeat protein [Chthonomonadaceae bacterium]
MPSPLLTIHLFGPLQVLVGEEPWPRVPTRSVEWLLALLVLRQSRAVDRSWLAGTLWPESEESQARHNLRNDLVHLRKALGSESARLQSPTRDTLRLDLEGAEADIVRFDAAILAGDAASLREAVALYTGPLLEGCYEAWVALERENREQACLAALETLAERAEAREDHAEAIRYLRQAQALDPLRDSIARRLMASLEATGNPGAAVEVYWEFRNRLQEELAAAPDEETTHLFQQIRTRAQETTRVSTRPPVSSSSGSISSGRLSARPPHPLASLIGREQEVEDVRVRLTQSRLVTLIGAGGVGKTRLAIEVAAHVEEAFVGGMVWIELASLAEGALLLPTLAAALGVRQEGVSHEEALLNRLVSQLSNGAFLLALDNCEHLLDAVAEIIQTLLSRCPDLRVLATSRQRLGLTGEVVWRVPSLPVPDAEQLPTDLAEARETALRFPAIQLFVERASSVYSEFQLTCRQEVEAVCRICHRLDGIPLAIELAAARVRSLTVEDIHIKLDQRFRLLTGGSRTALPRQQTLQSLIDWSYALLSEAEKALLCRLSVFSGGWTLEAAERVCAGKSVEEWEVLDLLTGLIDKSLVVAETSGMSVRYRLLETVREYGREKLLESGEEAVRERHTDFFLQWVEAAEPHFYGPEQSVWYERVEIEFANLRVVLEGCLKEESATKALRLALALSPFWDVRGYFKEGQMHLMTALSRVGAIGTEERMKALHAAGQLAVRQGDYALGRSLYEQNLTLQREAGDRRGMAWSLNALAHVALQQRDYALVRSLCEESLTISQELGDKPAMVGALYELAHVAHNQADSALARSLWEKCLRMQREYRDQRGIAGSLSSLGHVAYNQGDYAQARPLLEESLAMQRELGDKHGMVDTLSLLGHVAREVGEYERAGAWYQEGLRLHLEMGEAQQMALSLEDLATLAGWQAQEPNADLRQWAERAAQLLGAAETLRQTSSRTPSSPDPEAYARMVDTARAVLGEEGFAALGEETIVAAWEQGRAMSVEEALDFALTPHAQDALDGQRETRRNQA